MSDDTASAFEGISREAGERHDALSMRATGKLVGGSFIRTLPEITESVWGQGKDVVWAKSEPLMIAGATGLGKTTLSQALFRAGHRIGGMDAVLGFPVPAWATPTMYVAADRPRQAARAMRRIVINQEDAWLDEWLRWHSGAPLYSLSDPDSIDRMADDAIKEGVGRVMIDALKDVTAGLISDEAGQAIARSINRMVEADIDVLVNHHTRKSKDGKATLKSVDEIYGSTLIAGSMGSVVVLNGEPGDSLVKVEQIKFADDGGLDLLDATIDKKLGILVPAQATEFGEWMILQAGFGFDLRQAAQFLYKGNDQSANVSRAEKRKVERQLQHHVDRERTPHLVVEKAGGKLVYSPVIDFEGGD